MNVFRFFENLLDKKYEMDIGDISEGIQPRTVAAFMLEYLI